MLAINSWQMSSMQGFFIRRSVVGHCNRAKSLDALLKDALFANQETQPSSFRHQITPQNDAMSALSKNSEHLQKKPRLYGFSVDQRPIQSREYEHP